MKSVWKLSHLRREVCVTSSIWRTHDGVFGDQLSDGRTDMLRGIGGIIQKGKGSEPLVGRHTQHRWRRTSVASSRSSERPCPPSTHVEGSRQRHGTRRRSDLPSGPSCFGYIPLDFFISFLVLVLVPNTQTNQMNVCVPKANQSQLEHTCAHYPHRARSSGGGVDAPWAWEACTHSRLACACARPNGSSTRGAS